VTKAVRTIDSGFRWIAAVFAIAGAAGAYLLIVRFFDSNSDSQRRLAFVAGMIASAGGFIWMVLSSRLRIAHNRQRWMMILGPLGGVQFCSGVALISFAIDWPRALLLWSIVSAALMLAFTFSYLFRHR